jgi:protein O-mannosyl-transferase
MTDGGRRAVAALALTALATVPYLNALANGFVYDDVAQVVRNAVVRSLDPRPIFASGNVTHGDVEWYRPLTIYSLAVNYAASTLEPFWYHVTNIALHAANTVLVWSVSRALLASGLAALVAGALFATHPIHTEAVTPVFGRADLLAAFWLLLGWRATIGAGAMSPLWMAAVSFAFLAGLLSKENALALLPVVIITDLAQATTRGEPFAVRVTNTVKARWPLWTALVAVLAAWLMLRYAATGALTANWERVRYLENPLIEAGLIARIATALWIVLDYVRLFVFPYRLSADYSFNQIPVIRGIDARVIVMLAGAASVGAMAAWRWRGNPRRRTMSADNRLLVLVVLFAALIAPVSNVFFPIGTIMAERLLYLPSAALVMIAGLAVRSASRSVSRHSTRTAIVLAIVAVLTATSIATIVRNRDWRSETQLFAATVQASPRSAKARFNYGVALAETGDPDGARRMLESAVAIAPAYPEAHNLLGTIHLAAGEISAAGREFEAALRDSPGYAPALANLGIVRRREGQLEDARALLERALDADATMAVAHVNLAFVAETQGDRAAALQHYRQAFALDPALDVARSRAEALDPHPPR